MQYELPLYILADDDLYALIYDNVGLYELVNLSLGLIKNKWHKDGWEISDLVGNNFGFDSPVQIVDLEIKIKNK